MPLAIWWGTCGCYLWPLALGCTGRCRRCGEMADVEWWGPVDGRTVARPLTAREKQERGWRLEAR